MERGRGAQDEVVSDEEEMEEGWREEGWREEGGGEEGWREEGGGEEGGEDTQEEEVLTKMTPATDGETAVKTKTISRTKSTSSSNPKQAGIEMFIAINCTTVQGRCHNYTVIVHIVLSI